jgi:hypothetical protein
MVIEFEVESISMREPKVESVDIRTWYEITPEESLQVRFGVRETLIVPLNGEARIGDGGKVGGGGAINWPVVLKEQVVLLATSL